MWLGKISMGTFLVHVPVLNLFNVICSQSGVLPFDQPQSFVVIMLTVLMTAALWYYFIEKKLIPRLVCIKRDQTDNRGLDRKE